MIENPFNLIGKTILVTGASSGIGKEIALTLSKFGAHLVLNGRNTERLLAVKEQIHNESTIIIAGDLSDPAVIDNIVNSVSHFDGVVHAAGIMKLLPFKFINETARQEIMNINFMNPINISLKLIKGKKLPKNSSLVFITSINGSVVGSKANSMYAASKGALAGMIKAMAIDLAKNKIRVNEIAPGMIETEGADRIKEMIPENTLLEDIQKYPLGRYGHPLDVAYACVYLLADVSSWITGTKMIVDGGFTVQ